MHSQRFISTELSSQFHSPADSPTENELLWVGGWVVPTDVLDMTVRKEKLRPYHVEQILATQLISLLQY